MLLSRGAETRARQAGTSPHWLTYEEPPCLLLTNAGTQGLAGAFCVSARLGGFAKF